MGKNREQRREIRVARLVLWILSVGMFLHVPAIPAQDSSLLASWVELGPAGMVIARAVTSDAKCPPIMLNANLQPMQVRAKPSADFPVLVCEGIIAPGTTVAALNGQRLPLPPAEPRRIISLGDTGCRIKPPEHEVQNCNDPQAWPAQQVSASAAAMKPDLVIHVGDILYRELPCPPQYLPFCGNSPIGYNWKTFAADFFIPQAALLRAAPWVFVRGDHESCARAGKGWFLFFDPRPLPDSCQNFTDPYIIPVGTLQLQIFDSSAAHDTSAPADLVATYTAQLAKLRAVSSANAWFLTHKPVWGFSPENAGQLQFFNQTLQTASRNDFPTGVTMILTGHIHNFETLEFHAPRPRHVVVGTGGTALVPPITQSVRNTTFAGEKISTFQAIAQFGFLLFERGENRWRALMHDQKGKRLFTFAVRRGHS